MSTAVAIVEVLNAAITAISGAINLGLERQRAVALIDRASAEGRPLTAEEVDAELDDWLRTIDQVESTLPNPALSGTADVPRETSEAFHAGEGAGVGATPARPE